MTTARAAAILALTALLAAAPALRAAGPENSPPMPPAASTPAASASSIQLYPELSAYLAARRAEFDRIPAARRALLDELAAYVRTQRAAGAPVRLNFVCTHNSRRSHMAQLWAAASARHLGIDATCYSGGTETTAFNPRAVAALQRAGFRIDRTTDDTNPIYHVRFSDAAHPITCFSKIYDVAPNAKEAFAAIMVCDEADQSCPNVPGAAARIAIPYVDPKVSDMTPTEAATYDERCAQIAREMLYVMTRAASAA